MLLIALVVALVATTAANADLYPSNGDVVNLTPATFDRLVTQSNEVWLIEFYAPWCGHCKTLVPEYKKAAAALRGVVKVGAVNADEHKDLGGQFGVRGFPTIKIFGVNPAKPSDFNGQRTAQGLVDAALAEVKSKVKRQLGGGDGGSGSGSSIKSDVVELTAANFDRLVLQSDDMWLVEFYAPWCGHCKNLEPQWAKAAAELKGKVRLGALDATAHESKAQEYGITGYPTIKYFAAGPKRDRSDAQEFNGGRTAPEIVAWALERFEESVPAPEVVQLTGEKTARAACEPHPLCIVAVLPHILDCDAKCRNGYLKVLRELGDKYKKKQWGWLWSEGGAQLAVEEALEIGGFGYPTLVALSAKKMKYTTLRGSFGKDGINEFLRDISYGRGQTAPVKGAAWPKVEEVEAWDGKDGQLPVEEEWDLSDVDLDEKDEL